MFTADIRKFTRLWISAALAIAATGTAGAAAFAASPTSHASDGQPPIASTVGRDLGLKIPTAGQVPTQRFYGPPTYLFRPDGLLLNGLMPNPPTYG
jgi:hypothetical protein